MRRAALADVTSDPASSAADDPDQPLESRGSAAARTFPRRCTLIGGALLAASGLFPWFAAGAIATEPLRGRAAIATAIGVIVLIGAIPTVRAWMPRRWWRITNGVAAMTGLALVASSAIAPPSRLSASLGMWLGLVGALLVGLAVFASVWRQDWTPPSRGDAAEDGHGQEPHDGDDEASVPPPSGRPTWRRVARATGLIVACGLGALVVWPAPTPTLRADPRPTTTYDDAVDRFDELAADEGRLGVYEPCESQLLSHGARTAVSVVLFHGLTNCPKQFVEFGEAQFADGANVLILRAPHHGLADAAGTSIGSVANVGDLSPEALRDYADHAIDIGTGLGDEVRVLGLSMGGVIATWSAQERSDVARVVAVAPAMTIPGVPVSLTRIFRNVFDKLPNVSLPGSSKLDHAYAGETTKGLDATFAMAAYVADRAYASAPAATDVIVVLNPDDPQVDPVHLAGFADAWAAHGNAVTLHRLPAVGLPHDVIDLDQPDADAELVYPILFDLLDGVRR